MAPPTNPDPPPVSSSGAVGADEGLAGAGIHGRARVGNAARRQADPAFRGAAWGALPSFWWAPSKPYCRSGLPPLHPPRTGGPPRNLRGRRVRVVARVMWPRKCGPPCSFGLPARLRSGPTGRAAPAAGPPQVPGQGRGLFAARDLPPGAEILVEEPLACTAAPALRQDPQVRVSAADDALERAVLQRASRRPPRHEAWRVEALCPA